MWRTLAFPLRSAVRREEVDGVEQELVLQQPDEQLSEVVGEGEVLPRTLLIQASMYLKHTAMKGSTALYGMQIPPMQRQLMFLRYGQNCDFDFCFNPLFVDLLA